MSDLTDKLPVGPEGKGEAAQEDGKTLLSDEDLAEAESSDASRADPLTADPQDHEPPKQHSVPKWVKFGLPGLLAIVLVGGGLVLFGDDQETSDVSPSLGQVDAMHDIQASLEALDARVARMEALEARLNALDQQLDQSEASLQGMADVGEFSARMAALEEFLAESGIQTGLQLSALTERLDAKLSEAESAVEQAKAARPAAPPRAAVAKPRPAAAPKPAAPPRVPLRISGVEHRGGRAFLSVATGPVSSLNDVMLLGERESWGEWQLVQINATTAVFRYRGQNITVNLP